MVSLRLKALSSLEALVFCFVSSATVAQELPFNFNHSSVLMEETTFIPQMLPDNSIKELCPPEKDFPRTGDIIAQTSQSYQSPFIISATGSLYTHLGLVVERNEGVFVLEASSTVRYTPFQEWINRGVDKKYTLMRVLPELSYVAEVAVVEAEKFLGKDYDVLFDPSDKKMYCSELVQKAYERSGATLGKWEKFEGLLDLRNMALAREVKKRWGRVPESLSIVTPKSILESPLLYIVYSNFN
ncbi:MAG: YiiX/YebB-like N1pC/P60 family cysteine hydrolase [Nanoarchaeota archaeon]